MLIAFNKPFNVLSQFTDRSQPPRRTLAEFGLPKNVYAAGRLDYDSEGLLLLSDNGQQIASLSSPKFQTPKTYLAQIEGQPTDTRLDQLRAGVLLSDGPTRPAQVNRLSEPPDWLWPRDPPVRFRKTVPDTWIQVIITEGRNRQVRRMTAAVGLPTLRLIRLAIGDNHLASLLPGQWRKL